jgi:hypothetical protein
MDRYYVRTCSARQALVLAAADGHLTRLGKSAVRICRPSGRDPIDPQSYARYVARIEVLDEGPPADVTAGDPTAEVVNELFGPYLA